jgi:hypothetical protein
LENINRKTRGKEEGMKGRKYGQLMNLYYYYY